MTPRSIRRLLQGGLPFSLHTYVWLSSLLLSHSEEYANLDCQDPRPALPPLSRGTPLYAARTFLYPSRGSGRSALSGLAQSRCRVYFVSTRGSARSLLRLPVRQFTLANSF